MGAALSDRRTCFFTKVVCERGRVAMSRRTFNISIVPFEVVGLSVSKESGLTAKKRSNSTLLSLDMSAVSS